MEGMIKKFKSARSNLLLMIAMTTINLILIMVEASFSFLFTAFAPMFALAVFGELSMKAVGVAIAIIILAMYLVCYFLSKKYRVFILIALILFILDTLILGAVILLTLELQDASVLIDVGFHAWILYYLINGVIAWANMRKLPPEEIVEAEIILNKEDEEVEETLEAEEVMAEIDEEVEEAEVQEVIDAEIIMDDVDEGQSEK